MPKNNNVDAAFEHNAHGQNLADDNDVLPDDDDLASDRSQGTRSDLTLEESKRASAERNKRLTIDADLEARIKADPESHLGRTA